jgi:hypothetical protein
MNADNFSAPQQNSAFTSEVGQVEQMVIGTECIGVRLDQLEPKMRLIFEEIPVPQTHNEFEIARLL